MKNKFKTLVILLLLHNVLFAQQKKTFESYKCKIDSLVKLNLKYELPNFNILLNTGYDWQIVEYTKKYQFDTVATTRDYAAILIKTLGKASANKDFRKFAVNSLLEGFFLSEYSSPFGFNRSDFNAEAKQKIVTLITRPKTDLEIEIFLTSAWNTNKRNNEEYMDGLIKIELKKSNRSYNEIFDSLKNDYFINWKIDFTNQKIPSLYKAIGWLEMKDQIPFLEAQLQDSTVINYPDKEIVYWITASLIRMGQIEYYSDRFKNDDYLSWFLMQQEGYARSLQNLYSDKSILCTSPDIEMKEYLNALDKMQRELLNYPKKFWIEIDPMFWCGRDPLIDKPKGFLEKVRKWAKKHEGKYEISPDCYF